MPLPAPHLDDRGFQDLVDDGKRLLQQRCPEWSDHNVHDPGVTLIELFAWMTDQLLYRLNRVPERLYVKFLELVGVELFPPTAARAPVTFWLSAPQPTTVLIPANTAVATVRTEKEDDVPFTTTADLPIPACHLIGVGVETAAGVTDGTSALSDGGLLCFGTPPRLGDALLIALNEAAPSCVLCLRLRCRIEGIGVDPLHPPLAYEAWDGEAWSACEVEHDETGGLNRDGDIVLHLPQRHIVSVTSGRRAAWIRIRITDPRPGGAAYTTSPRVTAAEAFTLGGTVDALHGEAVCDEVLGTAEGVPGQSFPLERRPVVASGTPMVVEVGEGDGWVPWTQAGAFADSTPNDRHVVLDPISGIIRFGPAVREADGTLRRYGATPPKGAAVRVRSYRTGGGRSGNVARGAISVLKSSIPYVSRVENRRPALGGVDAEDLENAKVRGPIALRSRGRAVTAEDHEVIAREAAPELARVCCIPARTAGDHGVTRVLLVPAVDAPDGRVRFEQLIPRDETLTAIAGALEQRRLIGARIVIEPPRYQGITVVARLRGRPGRDGARFQEAAQAALYAYLHPTSGGPTGDGWPFGRSVSVGEIYAVLQRVEGTEAVEDAILFTADPATGVRGDASQRVELEPDELVFSYGHQVIVG